MSVWTRVKSLFASSDGEPEAPHYERFPDAQLLELWQAREDLTNVAREALQSELARRGLGSKKKKAQRRERETIVLPPPGEKLEGDIVDVKPGLGICLRSSPGRWVLVHLPLWNPAPPLLPSTCGLDAIVVCNDEARGWLSTTALQEAAGLGDDRVFAMSDGPIDRGIEGGGGSALRLPRTTTIGWLRLALTASGHAVHAQWRNSNVELLVGALLEPQDVDRAFYYVGSIPPPDRSLTWTGVLTAAHATALMAVAGMAPGPRIDVLLLGDAVGAHPDDHGHSQLGIGVNVAGRACPVTIDTVAALGATLAGRWDLVADRLGSDAAAHELAEHFMVEGELDSARRVLDIGNVRPGIDLSNDEAQLAALHGDLDKAIALYRQRLSTNRRDADARAGLAMLLSSRGDRDEAIEHARAVLAEDHDWISCATACRALWLAGHGDEARAACERIGVGIRASLTIPLEKLLAGIPSEGPSQPAFVGLACAARKRAQRSGGDDRERYLRRARELDPQDLECASLETLRDERSSECRRSGG